MNLFDAFKQYGGDALGGGLNPELKPMLDAYNAYRQQNSDLMQRAMGAGTGQMTDAELNMMMSEMMPAAKLGGMAGMVDPRLKNAMKMVEEQGQMLQRSRQPIADGLAKWNAQMKPRQIGGRYPNANDTAGLTDIPPEDMKRIIQQTLMEQYPNGAGGLLKLLQNK